jgi:cytochrome P450
MGDDVLSFEEGLIEILPVARIIEVSYSKRKRQTGPEFDYTKNPLIRTIRNNFKTHQLATFQQRLEYAVSKSIEEDAMFEPGNDYAVINMPFVQSMMVRISGLVFAGQAVGENKELLLAMSEYSQSIFNASILYMVFPAVVADFITRHTMSVGSHIGIMMKVLTPVLAQLIEEEKSSGKQKPMDFMHMMLHTPNSKGEMPTAEETAFWLQDAAFASLHTTSLFTMLALHNLSDRPDMQQLLREEITSTTDKYGKITLDIMKHMPVVDSFVRETLRLGGDYIGMNHKAKQDVVLSNGILIPKGTSVGMAINDAHLDPELQHITKGGVPLTQFDPLRFVGQPSKKSTSVGPDLLVFGIGHHACPGRYFATHQIGYIIVRMLLQFEIVPSTMNGKRAANRLALVGVICIPWTRLNGLILTIFVFSPREP